MRVGLSDLDVRYPQSPRGASVWCGKSGDKGPGGGFGGGFGPGLELVKAGEARVRGASSARLTWRLPPGARRHLEAPISSLRAEA